MILACKATDQKYQTVTGSVLALTVIVVKIKRKYIIVFILLVLILMQNNPKLHNVR